MASEPPPVQRSRTVETRSGSPISALSSAKAVASSSPTRLRGDNDALVDIERHALDVGAIEQIGGGLAGRRPRFDEREQPRPLRAEELGVEKRIERVDRQTQTLEDEEGGFVERGRCPLAESEIGGDEPPDRIAQPIARRREQVEPLVGRPFFRQGRTSAGPCFRRSHAAPAFVQEVLARLALQPARVRLLRAFDRAGRPRAGVLVGAGLHLDRRRAAIHRHISRVSDGDGRTQSLGRKNGQYADASQSHVTHKRSYPVLVDGSFAPRAGYKGGVWNFKPNAIGAPRRKPPASEAFTMVIARPPCPFSRSKRSLIAFPRFRVAFVLAEALKVAPERSPRLAAEIAAAEDECRRRWGGVELSAIPEVAAWRTAYKGFGVKRTSYRSSVERIIKRVLAGDSLPKINALVDLYNMVSLEAGLCLGCDDLDKTSGGLDFRFAKQGDSFIDMGAEAGDDPNDPPKDGEVVYADARHVLCRRWNWRQDVRTAVSLATHRAVLTAQSNGAGDVEAAAARLDDLMGRECGARCRIVVLDQSRPTAEI